MKTETNRSSSVPRLVAGAGILAASSLAGMSANKAVSQATSDYAFAQREPNSCEMSESGRRDGVSVLTLSLNEEWDAERHMPELRRLILLKARGRMTSSENMRLKRLQEMRRASLPLAMSYEQFMRERQKADDLDKLVGMLAEYKRKYGGLA